MAQHDFQFTKHWFETRNEKTFLRWVKPVFEGRPITYFEIGVFEGMSLVWMFQNILTHPESRGVGVDPWLMTAKLGSREMRSVMERAHHNLSPWMQAKTQAGKPRCELIRANSCEVMYRAAERRPLAGIGPETLDLCMIDGGHFDVQAFDDARKVLPLMKIGGVILFDDVRNAYKKTEHVAQGLRMFVDQYGDRVRRVWTSRIMRGYERIS
jgi:hypothetical protein